MDKEMNILVKVIQYEMFIGGGYIPLLMSLTINPIRDLLKEGCTLDPKFFEEFSLPQHPMEWYVSEDRVIKARPMEQ